MRQPEPTPTAQPADDPTMRQTLAGFGVSWPPATRAERRRLARLVRKAAKRKRQATP